MKAHFYISIYNIKYIVGKDKDPGEYLMKNSSKIHLWNLHLGCWVVSREINGIMHLVSAL